MEDLEDRDENDAERGRGIGRHQARLDKVQRDQDERDDRPRETQVQAGIEQMFFVFKQS